MARYFFDIQADGASTIDDVGLDFDREDEAQAEAVRALPEIARDVPQRRSDRVLTASVRREGGPVFFRATLTMRCDWPEGKAG